MAHSIPADGLNVEGNFLAPIWNETIYGDFLDTLPNRPLFLDAVQRHLVNTEFGQQIIIDPLGDRFRTGLPLTARGGDVPTVGWSQGNRSYTVETAGLAVQSSDADLSAALDRERYGFGGFKTRENSIAFLSHVVTIGQEQRFLDAVCPSTAGPWNTTLTGVTTGSALGTPPTLTQFDSFLNQNVDPIATLQVIYNRTRLKMPNSRPDSMIMARDVWDALVVHAKIVARIAITTPLQDRVVTELALETLLKNVLRGIKNVYVAESVANTAVPGAPFSGVDMTTGSILFYARGTGDIYNEGVPGFDSSIVIRDYTPRFLANMATQNMEYPYQSFFDGRFIFQEVRNNQGEQGVKWSLKTISKVAVVDASFGIHMVSALA